MINFYCRMDMRIQENRLIAALFILLLFGLFFTTTAQISQGGIPVSTLMNLSAEGFQDILIAVPQTSILEAEDLKRDKEGLPQRFAVHLPVELNTQNSGSWTFFDNGKSIWRLKLKAEGAMAVGLHFTDFSLPQGCELFLYDDNREQLMGAFTSLNNRKSGLFATDLIYGESVIIDLYVPQGVEKKIYFTLSEVVFAYRYVVAPKEKSASGSDFCEVNINCSPEGDNWQDIKKGVVRIQVKVGGGSFWCTGSLVNTTRQDFTPYILTADHCAFQAGQYASASDLENWIFRFDFEGATCASTTSIPSAFTLTGALRIAQGGSRGLTGSDFYLVKLIDDIPESKGVFYLGWTIENEAVNSGVSIHHPNGDIKKISSFTTPIQTSGWSGNGLPSHWRVIWSETENGWGVTEGGSSGSPLIDDSGRIIGTLTGGLAACEPFGNIGPDKPDYYGKFSYHWTSNGNSDTSQLKPWLDPDNSGVIALNGLSSLKVEPPADVNKRVKIFPNPSNGKFTIELSTFVASDFRVTIYDLKGKPFHHCQGRYIDNSIEMDCNELPSGIYIFEIRSAKELFMNKFVIAK